MRTPIALAVVMLSSTPAGWAWGKAPAPAATPSGFELGAVTILVRNEDEAADWYERNLGMRIALDTRSESGERFVAMVPVGRATPMVVLHRPRTTDISVDRTLPDARIGQETYWVWRTGDFDASYKRLLANGVKFVSPPRDQFYGREAVFEDLYGNLFILQQIKAGAIPSVK